LKRNRDAIAKATQEAKESADKTKANQDTTSVSKSSVADSGKETKQSIARKPLVRDYKNRSPSKLKIRRHSPSPTAKSRSRSKSPSQSKIIKLKRRVSGCASGDEAEEDFNTKIQRSRLNQPQLAVVPPKFYRRSHALVRDPR
jgi:hypothetical protein